MSRNADQVFVLAMDDVRTFFKFFQLTTWVFERNGRSSLKGSVSGALGRGWLRTLGCNFTVGSSSPEADHEATNKSQDKKNKVYFRTILKTLPLSP